jgi:hypothetical protein
MDQIIVEKWLTFTLVDGKWDKEKVAPLASFLPASVLLPPTSRVHGATHAVDMQGPGETIPGPTRPGVNLPTRSLHGYATIPDWAY